MQELQQERFSTGLSPSTLNVYVAAIATYHPPLSGHSGAEGPGMLQNPTMGFGHDFAGTLQTSFRAFGGGSRQITYN